MYDQGVGFHVGIFTHRFYQVEKSYLRVSRSELLKRSCPFALVSVRLPALLLSLHYLPTAAIPL